MILLLKLPIRQFMRYISFDLQLYSNVAMFC